MNTAIIHSKISHSEQFLQLGNEAALLFMLSWAHCDDYGRINASPGHWVLKVCPGRFVIKQVAELLQEIEAVRDRKGEPLIKAYELNGERFFYVTNWFRYQGFRHDYVVKATCPHPLLGVVEPNVTAKTLTHNFSDLERYNLLAEDVDKFLKQGEKSRETKANSRETQEQSRENANQSARQTRGNSEKPREKGPPSSSASSSPPASSSAPASSPNKQEEIINLVSPQIPRPEGVLATQTFSGAWDTVGALAIKPNLAEILREPERLPRFRPRTEVRGDFEAQPVNEIALARRRKLGGMSIQEILDSRVWPGPEPMCGSEPICEAGNA